MSETVGDILNTFTDEQEEYLERFITCLINGDEFGARTSGRRLFYITRDVKQFVIICYLADKAMKELK